MDHNISRLRVLFTLYIVLYHSVDDYFLGHMDTIHPHEELEFLRGITNFVLQGFVFISGFLMARGFFCYGKYSNKFKFFIDKTQRLLIPYFVGGHFFALCTQFLGQKYSMEPSIYGFFLCFLMLCWLQSFLLHY